MEFCILGPVEVYSDGVEIHLGGPRMAFLLAALALHPNQAVPVARLVEEVWGDGTPRAANATLYSYVCKLRARLASVGPDGERRILTDTCGYRLRVEPGELDAEIFRTYVERSREAYRLGLMSKSRLELTAGLNLWRDNALPGAPGRIAQSHAMGLDEARISAIEDRFDTDLLNGSHAETVPELRAMVHRYPLRERLARQLMLALYRCGQQAEALELYRKIRFRMIDQLGIEPGEDLQAMHQRILNHDTRLIGVPKEATVTMADRSQVRAYSW